MQVPELALRALAAPAGSGAAPLVTETWLDDRGAVHARCEVLDGGYRVEVPGVASFAFRPGGDPVGAERCAGVSEPAIRDAYRRHVQPLVLHALGLEVLHASAVLTARGVAAFCAPTGGGKSTLGAALSRAGYRLWADDALALDFGEGAPVALRLPFEPRLRPPARAVLGDVGGLVAPVRGAGPERAPLGLLGLLEPVEAGAAAGIERVPGAAAFAALLPHAFCFAVSDTERTRRMVGRYLALAARVPVWRVPVEAGLDRLPRLVERIGRFLGPAGSDR